MGDEVTILVVLITSFVLPNLSPKVTIRKIKHIYLFLQTYNTSNLYMQIKIIFFLSV